jgi:hypothetical protein
MVSEQFVTELSEVSGVDFRGTDVPVGEVIHEQKLDGNPGASATWRKSPSKVRMGEVPLPDRVALYNVVTYDRSMVPPTIAQKRMSEHPGRYTMRKPADWDDRAPKPIDETCEVCRKRRALEGNGPKPFYDELDLEGHYEFFHPREWARIQRERERLERQGEQSTTNKLIASIASLFQQGRGAELPAEVSEAMTGKICERCGGVIEGTDSFATARHNKKCPAKDGG